MWDFGMVKIACAPCCMTEPSEITQSGLLAWVGSAAYWTYET